MTPPPATAAAAGHQRSVRRGAGTRGPRRVSGPSRAAGGARAARANAAAAVAANASPLPFEVAGGRAGARVGVARPVGLPRTHTPLVHRLSRVTEHTWLDRLLRSRGWIVVVGILLIGLVFMQVSLLKLNSGMGRDVERSTVLERQNSLNRAKVSQLESNDRIQQMAVRMGMLLPASDGVRYLGSDGRRIGGGSTTQVPSQAEASTALLPTAPADPTADPTATGTTGTTPAAPETTSSVPGAAAAVPQSTTTQTGTPTSTSTPTPSSTTTGTATSTSTGTGAAVAANAPVTNTPATPTGTSTGTPTATQTGAATPTTGSTGQTDSATGGATPGA